MKIKSPYDYLTDNEWVELLAKQPADEKAHNYFFKVKCAKLLQYIATTIFNSDNYFELIGEFYVYLSADDWHVLRAFKNKNGASLYSYLSRCAFNLFMMKKKKETQSITLYNDLESHNILTDLNEIADTDEENTENQDYISKAYNKLSQREKDVLRLLVIDGKSGLEAAEHILPYVKSTKDWRNTPAIEIQKQIAIIKHRAILKLQTEFHNLVNYRSPLRGRGKV